MGKITSVSHPLIQDLKAVRQGKPSRFMSHFLIEGLFEIQEAARAGILVEVLTTDQNLEVPGVKIHDVVPHVIEQLSTQKNPSGYLGVCNEAKMKKDFTSQVLLLDQVSDPGNVGTLIRTAFAFGITTIVLTDDSVNPLNPKVIAASQGALFHVNLHRLTPRQIIEKLSFISSWYITSLNPQSVDVASVVPPSSWVVVLGNETRGLTDRWNLQHPLSIHIPMKQFDSLNVGVAGSIVLYQLQKKAGML